MLKPVRFRGDFFKLVTFINDFVQWDFWNFTENTKDLVLLRFTVQLMNHLCKRWELIKIAKPRYIFNFFSISVGNGGEGAGHLWWGPIYGENIVIWLQNHRRVQPFQLQWIDTKMWADPYPLRKGLGPILICFCFAKSQEVPGRLELKKKLNIGFDLNLLECRKFEDNQSSK